MIRALVLLIASTALCGAEGPRITYSRELPGALPPYVQVVVERDGAAVYRESVDDPDDVPVKFRLRPAETDEIYDLAKKLKYFSKPLESNLKVANMGLKTFRYEDGDTTNEQQFNFSQDADARVLADWFARATESVNHLLNLERAARFDKLGVNKILLQIQVSLEKNRLVAADEFLPLLNKIAGDESYLNMARTRAADLATYIQESAQGVSE